MADGAIGGGGGMAEGRGAPDVRRVAAYAGAGIMWSRRLRSMASQAVRLVRVRKGNGFPIG